MGKLLYGPFGPVTGVLGNTSCYVLDGEAIIRIKPRKRTKFSIKELNNQQRLSVVNDFFRKCKDFLRVGFGPDASGAKNNYYNIAVSYNKTNALKGYYPDVEMDYSKVLFSNGKELTVENPIVKLVDNRVVFSWDSNTDNQYNYSNDQVMMLVYFPGKQQFFTEEGGAKRSVGTDHLKIPNKLVNEPMETYISFISNDRKSVATSIYTGRIN